MFRKDLGLLVLILVIGAMFIGGLASLIGARWATISLSVAGTLAMAAIWTLMPRARRMPSLPMAPSTPSFGGACLINPPMVASILNNAVSLAPFTELV